MDSLEGVVCFSLKDTNAIVAPSPLLERMKMNVMSAQSWGALSTTDRLLSVVKDLLWKNFGKLYGGFRPSAVPQNTFWTVGPSIYPKLDYLHELVKG